MTVVLILVLVASVAGGVWDLLGRGSRAPVRAALTCEAGLIVGAILQAFMPAGFFVGAAAGLLTGIPAFRRWARGRLIMVQSMGASREDAAVVLLELRDHLDSLDSDLRPIHRVTGGLALLLLAVTAVSMVTIGLLDDRWTFLLIGSLAAFLPAGHLMRLLSERSERRALEEAIVSCTGVIADGPDQEGAPRDLPGGIV